MHISLSESERVRLMCHTLQAYSRVRGNMIRISLQYGCIPHLPASKYVKNKSLWCLRYHGSSLCFDPHSRSLLVITPSNLVEITLSTVLSLIVIVKISRGKKLSCLFTVHTCEVVTYQLSTASVAVYWIWLSTADAEYTSHSVLSSTYLYSGNQVCRLFMKPTGPTTTHWENLYWWYTIISDFISLFPITKEWSD